jgi:hypothetical protein
MAAVMIKVVGLDGHTYNLNVENIQAVRYATVNDPFDLVIGATGQRAELPPGAFLAAIAALRAEYNTNPKVADHLFIGTTP